MGNHRADPRAHRAADLPAGAVRQPGGRRKATKGSRARRTGVARTPALPTVIGATALLIAGAGAVGLNNGALGHDSLSLSSGHSVGGTDAFAFLGGASRAQAVSRDSERRALQAAQTRQLKSEVESQSQQRNATLTSLAHDAEQRANQIAKNLWHLPTENFHLTARFGMTSGLWATFHTGLDFAADPGTPIFAVANGVITSTGWDGSYGNKTVETLADGTEIWYAHQEEIDVHPGDKVTEGQTIGRVGSTGNTTGPHVHIEVRPHGGAPVDPYTAFVQHGITP